MKHIFFVASCKFRSVFLLYCCYGNIKIIYVKDYIFCQKKESWNTQKVVSEISKQRLAFVIVYKNEIKIQMFRKRCVGVCMFVLRCANTIIITINIP